MEKKDKDIALFVVFCVEEYAASKGMTGEQVVNLFAQYGVTDYLSNCFEPLHTQGRQWLIAEIDDFIETKRSQSLNPINQNNLHLLLPGKISWLVEYLHDDYGLSLQDSLQRIYHSELYKKLSTESTKYWHLGPVDLYRELKSEL